MIPTEYWILCNISACISFYLKVMVKTWMLEKFGQNYLYDKPRHKHIPWFKKKHFLSSDFRSKVYYNTVVKKHDLKLFCTSLIFGSQPCAKQVFKQIIAYLWSANYFTDHSKVLGTCKCIIVKIDYHNYETSMKSSQVCIKGKPF